MSSEHGIDYVLAKTHKTEISGMKDLPKLQNQFIPLDHLTTSKSKTDVVEQRKINRNERKHATWKSLATRKFRKDHMKYDKSKITYELIEPISKLWLDYAGRISSNEQSVTKMDLHGAPITVISSKDPNLIGFDGLIVKESAGAIIVVSKDNKVKQINKNHTLVCLHHPKQNYEINLTAIRCRPFQRPTKKFKMRTPLNLPF